MYTVGVIGNGFVGNATSQFENNEIAMLIYDISPDKCQPSELTLQEICKRSDIIFICVPTPMKKDGSCFLGIIENLILEMKLYSNLDKKPVVIRSTVPVGTVSKLNCFFMPEFLLPPLHSPSSASTTRPPPPYSHTKSVIQDILVSNSQCGNIKTSNSMFVLTDEAESIKLFKNTFLAVKVGFCNEFYRFCEGNNVNYSKVIEGVITDERITESHTNVPGNNGLFGFGGTCFPKDISSLQNQMKQLEVQSPITNAVIFRNNEIDRKQQDWKEDEGRAFINS